MQEAVHPPWRETAPLSDPELDARFTRVLRDVFSGASAEGAAYSGVPLKPGPVLILPPDTTRIHSRAGLLTAVACRELGAFGGAGDTAAVGDAVSAADAAGIAGGRHVPRPWSLGAIMPALGTHRPLTAEEIGLMFPGCPADRFLPHRWRSDTLELGRLPAEWVAAAFSAGGAAKAGPGSPEPAAFYLDWPVQVNRLLREGLPGRGPFSLIISIGQVTPHEIAGMANHTKNIFIGAGGAEGIHKSHWLGALYGLERLMGVTENPVRALFDEAFRRYKKLLPPILWVLSVVDCRDAVRGLFCGFERDCFTAAAALAAELNIERITGGVKKMVVWLGEEFRSTWLGNKAVYRTRRAMADGGELLILAPQVECFGEDPALDTLIRRYGYRGTAAIRRAVAEDPELADNLSAAAHLIHGSGEGRFIIRYCSAGTVKGFGRRDIEQAGYEWGNLEEAIIRYAPEGPESQNQGWNTTADGERYYFIRNPALGLWIA
jgi:nickel-dependent lactate racemase